MKKARKFILIIAIALPSLCLLLILASALSNRGLPQHSEVVETLSQADKIRLAETIRLHQGVGDAVWPGWSQAETPVILYNEAYAFLVDYPVQPGDSGPPDGWIKVPDGTVRGGPWEITPGDNFQGRPYYRQALPDPDVTPQSFVVQVGEQWVPSLTTYDWTRIKLVEPIRQDLPAFLRPVFPYRLFIGVLLGNSEHYISFVAHEAFHAYQGTMAAQKLADAENTNRQVESRYPWDDVALQAGWQTELDLLADALRTTERTQTLELARKFLETRASRREAGNLAQELVGYEQQREWVEGLARYAELEIWRQANAGNYTPLDETSTLSDFDGYTGFDTRWSREIDQIGRMTEDEGDGRFYYSGMAQAFMLDRLLPDWKLRAFDDGVWLEDLLAEAVNAAILQ